MKPAVAPISSHTWTPNSSTSQLSMQPTPSFRLSLRSRFHIVARRRNWDVIRRIRVFIITAGNVSEKELSMNSVQIEQKSYEMPPQEGISIAHFSPSPTSSGRLATTKQSSALAF